MKKLTIFLLISFLLHAMLVLIGPKPSEPKQKDITRVEIVPKEEIAKAPPSATPQITDPVPPEDVKPVTPAVPKEPQPTQPVRPSETPTPDPEPIPDSEYIIKPKRYDPDNPPPIASFEDFLRERDKNSSSMGPDRPVDDIVRDWLEKHGQDDIVSFHNIAVKYDSYFYKFSRALYSVWRYPDESARKGESGIVRITFSILKDGTITNLSMIESSGYQALDREVMRTLRTMEKVPLPASFNKEQLNINGFFIYSLNGSYILY